MKYYLATTGISEIWDLDSQLLLLSPWCSSYEKNKKLFQDTDYVVVSSPWKPVFKIKDAADYCQMVYEKLLLACSEELNSIHQVSYPVIYWRILLGPWLLHFIGMLYDKYKRIEKTLELFPDFYTHVLSEQRCQPLSYDTYEFLNTRINEDYYNLVLYSLVLKELCPPNIVETTYEPELKINTNRYNWRRKLFNRIIKLLDLSCKGSIVLTDMCHLTHTDMFFIKWKAGLRTVRFMDFESTKAKPLQSRYSSEFRKRMKLKGYSDRFQSLLYRILPRSIPVSYMENYNFYKSSIDNIKNVDSVRTIGSTTGWIVNEEFKFFAAEKASTGAKLITFQHGGGYGSSLVVPHEKISLEKDIFYTWGWNSNRGNKVKSFPSPHLSRIKETYSPKLDKILFVGTCMPRYQYRLHTALLPEDMPKYFEDKKIFFQALTNEIKKKALYRPAICDFGWGERELIKKMLPDIKVAFKGTLVKWMQKVKLIVIDHPHTSFIEALTINAPCIFYWDHRVYLMRDEAEKYFELLREVGILHKGPEVAAQKVKNIFYDPMSWWLSKKVQDARLKFCERFAYCRKDWMMVWEKELRGLHRV